MVEGVEGLIKFEEMIPQILKEADFLRTHPKWFGRDPPAWRI
jgi:hypothetical protein